MAHRPLGRWLGDCAPYVETDQKHLNENSPERAYWHYGYLAALTDVLKLLGGDGEQGDEK